MQTQGDKGLGETGINRYLPLKDRMKAVIFATR